MSSDGLTAGQIEVANAFFGLVESQGFVVAGGAALLALGLSTRPTQDLDVFTAPPVSSVRSAFEAFSVLAGSRQWTVEPVTIEETFCRFLVDIGHERVLVDLAIDSAQSESATITVLGPTMAAEEVAARKLLALFDRGEARDFADVYQLAKQFDRTVMLERAASIDLGFDRDVLADVMYSHRRFSDDELPVGGDSVAELRAYFDDWSKRVTSETAEPRSGAERWFAERMEDPEYRAGEA
jgi:hypothetical protein